MPDPRLDPRAHALVRSQLSRRSLLAGAGALGLVAALGGCGTKGTGTTASGAKKTLTAAKDRSATDKSLRWANWTLYLDYDEKTKKYPTLEAFSSETGIKTSYAEDIEDNDSYYGKIQAQLRNGQDFGQDIITLTDWMAGRLIKAGWTQALDDAAVPNARKNLLPTLKDVGFDPGREHSVTWQSGFAVLAWNKEKVPGGVHSIADLWSPKLKGRVEVLSEMRDTIGLIMMSQGRDPSGQFTSDDFHNALDVLAKNVDNGQIRQVKGNSYKEDLISGDALAVIGWSGDIFQINAENHDKWGVTLPDSGGTLWSDNLMVPIGSPHKANAEKLIDYYYRPDVAAKVAAYVNYVCPVVGAKAEMEKIDPQLAASPWIFPDDAMLANAKVFRPLTADEETSYSEAFQKVIGN